MKKIISLLLALVMCAALFAGCGGQETPGTSAPETTAPVADTTALSNAREYLYTIYKETAGTVTALDYTVISQVSVGSDVYPIEWTIEAVSGDASLVTVVAGEEMTTITITPNYGAEEIKYNLVGTLKDAAGNTDFVSFEHTVPVSVKSDIVDGTYVIAADGLSFAALDPTYNYGYAPANPVTADSYTNADVVTITTVSGGVTIQDCYGRYIYLKGTYNSYNVSAEMPEEGHIWEIRAEEDGYTLVNVLNQKTIAYSTSYSSWGAYPELTDADISLLTITPATLSEETPDATEPDATEPEETEPSVDAPVASVEDGTKVVIFNAENNAYATGTEYTYVSSSTGNEKLELELTESADAALVLTVKVDGDTVTFVTDDGKYLYADGTNVKLADAEDDNTKFVLETVDGGYLIKCAIANYNGKPQYLEIYSGYLTVYGYNEANAGIYTFQLIAQ